MKEENEGFRIQTKKADNQRPNKFNGSKKTANGKGMFKVSIEGANKRRSLADDDDDDDDEDVIEEDIQTDRDENLLGGNKGGIGNGLADSA